MTTPPTGAGESEVRTRELRLHGHTLSYRTAGSGPVVLLLHGIAGTAEAWVPSMRLLARRFTVIAPDLPGHGDSDKAAGDYSLGALANSMRDLLVGLGHSRATIVGHSLGGGIAMQFAYQYPERCERLVLVGSGGLGRSVNGLLRAAALPGAGLVLSVAAPPIVAVGGLLGSLAGRIGLRAAPDVREVSRGFATLVDGDTRSAFLETLRSVVSPSGQRVDATSKLYLAAGMPVLIVWGARDPIIPANHGRRAHELIPNSTYVEFEDAGHMPHADDPHRFADVVVDFVDANPPGRATAESWSRLLRAGGPDGSDAVGGGSEPVGVGSGRADAAERLDERHVADRAG
ncbi:MAG TPA: alpha/beta hydrolase [Solirubrobacteraceae bacterium]|jgi:pimeloyl-ACP methyl ester carboxylesterase|nr:alpha/beta hydrolase [Solirubrobacteraceae bacterium]